MNGWRRLWLAVTALSAIVVAIAAFIETDDPEDFWDAYFISKELKKPACAEFANGVFALREPEYSADSSTCYFIYTQRRYSDGAVLSESGRIHRLTSDLHET